MSASYLLENPSSSVLSPRVSTPDVNEINMFDASAFRGQEVKEALRAQMEVERKLHEQVEVTKPISI
ncbi:hypothetical protein BHM03_00006057 [Ensete ventricosum]|nr:hypothetical protein BHM03_00006057 [Ensete ventricosum]